MGDTQGGQRGKRLNGKSVGHGDTVNGNGHRNPHKNKKSNPQNEKPPQKRNLKQKHKDTDNDRGTVVVETESTDTSEYEEEDEVDEAENRLEWMEKMVNMGFEADKAFEAIAQSADFNEALERLMQSIV